MLIRDWQAPGFPNCQWTCHYLPINTNILFLQNHGEWPAPLEDISCNNGSLIVRTPRFLGLIGETDVANNLTMITANVGVSVDFETGHWYQTCDQTWRSDMHFPSPQVCKSSQQHAPCIRTQVHTQVSQVLRSARVHNNMGPAQYEFNLGCP